jgi:hypothetical protein
VHISFTRVSAKSPNGEIFQPSFGPIPFFNLSGLPHPI